MRSRVVVFDPGTTRVFGVGAEFTPEQFVEFARDHPGLRALWLRHNDSPRLVAVRESGLAVDELSGDVLCWQRNGDCWRWRKRNDVVGDNIDIDDPHLCPRCLRLTQEVGIEFEYGKKQFMVVAHVCPRCGGALPTAQVEGK